MHLRGSNERFGTHEKLSWGCFVGQISSSGNDRCDTTFNYFVELYHPDKVYIYLRSVFIFWCVYLYSESQSCLMPERLANDNQYNNNANLNSTPFAFHFLTGKLRRVKRVKKNVSKHTITIY